MGNKGIVTIDGFELAYRIEGEGTPVLVVGSEVYYPRLFSEEIKQKLKLIFIDHRGFVEPPRVLKPEDYSLDRVLDDIEIIRETLALENFVILGHSGHAFMALEYARKYPAHVQKVVLLNTAPSNSPERQKQSRVFFEETASPERKIKFEQDIALLPGDLEREPERRFAHVCTRMGAHSFCDYSFDAAPTWDGVYTNMEIIDHLWGDAFGKIDLLQRVMDLNKPVFLGLGRYDYLVGPSSLWDSLEAGGTPVKKIVFEQSGHNPMVEESHVFDSALVDWIEAD